MKSGGAIAWALFAALCVGCGPKAAPQVSPPSPVALEQKLQWLMDLEDQRQAAGPAPGQSVVTLLTDREPRVRRRAALAAGRVRLIEAIEPLSALLVSEPDPEVRQMAAFALGLIGNASAADVLIAALGVADPLVQGSAADALGLIGHKPAAAPIGAMLTALIGGGALADIPADDVSHPKGATTEAARLAIYALVRLGAYDTLAGTLLEKSGAPRSRWWPVAYAFQRIGDAKAAPVLVQLLQGEGVLTRAFAARGLASIKHAPAAAALAALAGSASEPDAVRVQAVRALGAIAAAGSGVALQKIITAPKVAPNLRLEAIVALGQLRTPGAVDLLVDLASAPAPATRVAALTALARTDADTFIAVLSGLDDDAHWSVRAGIASALGDMGAERGEVRLVAMLSDRDKRVVPAVLTALVRARAASAGPALLRALGDEDAVVRMAAAKGLAELKTAGASAALVAALGPAGGDGSYVARAAMLEALTTIDPAAATTALTSALDDRDWAVRVRAAELLRRLKPASTASPSRPAPPSLVADIAQVSAVAPAFSPVAYIDTEKGMIQIELAVIEAPRTVANFVSLVGKGFFNGITFHRVVPDFVAQGGDPRGDGEGGPGYTIRDELSQRPYVRGTVGMALDWADTGSSQFFITHSPQPHLDARYTVFGQVVSGMDVVDALSQWDLIRTVRVWDGANWIGPQ